MSRSQAAGEDGKAARMSGELAGVGIVSGTSPSIAIGRAHLLAPSELETRHYAIERKDVLHEVARLNNAFSLVRSEIDQLAALVAPDAPGEVRAFLDLHRMILDDPLLCDEPRDLVRSRLINAEWALTIRLEQVCKQFVAIDDEYFRSRSQDVRQVVERGFTPIGILGELVSIGTLFAFVIVSIGVPVLRIKQPHLERPFKTPFVPVVPIASALVALLLMAGLPLETWERLVVWMQLGLMIYGAYGYHRSVIQQKSGGQSAKTLGIVLLLTGLVTAGWWFFATTGTVATIVEVMSVLLVLVGVFNLMKKG